MPQNTLIIAIDLGTSATTASHARVRDVFDNQRKLRREILGTVSDVKDWPGCIEGATGDVCVPTDLVFHRDTRQLLFWGFEAQQYLDDPFHDIPDSDIFVVETIKLLLPDPDEANIQSSASARYRAKREVLTAALRKQPEDVFEDFLSPVLEHILYNAKRKYSVGLQNHKIELVLAFPSGWPDYIHTMVARIGAKAMEKAIAIHNLGNVAFGIEQVYTVSETLCGVKEWLRETVAESSLSTDFEPHPSNLDELQVGDYFLPVDIGGGTGCLTPLKLVSKNPLGVEQLDKTQSLEVSGEAVQAEFERWLHPQITKKDYPGDIERLVYQICRKFKEEKKKCGTTPRSGSKTWNFPVPRLKANPRKGFEKDCMRFDRKNLDKCFDPVIDILDLAIEATMRKYPTIKVIVFLGQFGGNSAYLQKRMASNPISRQVKVRHSQNGKMDVIKGAMSERLTLEEAFVRRFTTLKSYGTLVNLSYGDEAARIFPDPQRHGAVPFENAEDGLRLKVIEWAIPRGTVVQDGRTRDIGKDSGRHHTWPLQEPDIGFDDIIIVSDEDVPTPQLEGSSYTLWTEAHKSNQLYINGQRKQVQQIEFGWDLIMSQKLDNGWNIVGSYEKNEMQTSRYPEKKIKGHQRRKFRRLDYDLMWEITEMQVKVYVGATFPNQVGASLFQLAKEQELGPDAKIKAGESRSKGLEKDIEIAHGEGLDEEEEDDDDDDEGTVYGGERREVSPYRTPGGFQPINRLARALQQPHEAESSTTNSVDDRRLKEQLDRLLQKKKQPVQVVRGSQQQIPHAILTPTVTSQRQPRDIAEPSTAPSSSNARADGRCREGCYTCKDRKKKCDITYIFDETSGTQKCNTCLRFGVPCYMTKPEWAHDPAEKQIRQLERSKLIKLGKRKSRDESVSSRERSMTFGPAVVRSIETNAEGISGRVDEQRVAGERPLKRGTMTAIRGGKGGSNGLRH